jgi:hypothetical protein
VVHAVVHRLETYPEWLDLVNRVVEDSAGGQPAWQVDLRGQLGPIRRTKRLRMVRTVDEVDHVRFERHELDGREHAPWILDARIGQTETETVLTMTLRYEGRRWVPLLDRVLADEIERARPRLLELLDR